MRRSRSLSEGTGPVGSTSGRSPGWPSTGLLASARPGRRQKGSAGPEPGLGFLCAPHLGLRGCDPGATSAGHPSCHARLKGGSGSRRGSSALGCRPCPQQQPAKPLANCPSGDVT